MSKNLCRILKTNTTLTSLSLSPSVRSCYKLGSQDAKLLAEALAQNQGLTYIDLANQPIGDEGGLCLFEALTQNTKTQIRKINWFNTGIGKQTKTAFLKYLEVGHCKMELQI